MRLNLLVYVVMLSILTSCSPYCIEENTNCSYNTTTDVYIEGITLDSCDVEDFGITGITNSTRGNEFEKTCGVAEWKYIYYCFENNTTIKGQFRNMNVSGMQFYFTFKNYTEVVINSSC